MIVLGIILILIYLLNIKKFNLRNTLSLSEGAYLLFALSFIINNNKLYPIAITFCISNLIANIIILKNYKIIDKYDFIIHYLPIIFSIFLLLKNKQYQYNYKYLVALLLFYLIVNIVYKIVIGEFIYPQAKLNTFNGILKLIVYIGIIFGIFFLLK